MDQLCHQSVQIKHKSNWGLDKNCKEENKYGSTIFMPDSVEMHDSVWVEGDKNSLSKREKLNSRMCSMNA